MSSFQTGASHPALSSHQQQLIRESLNDILESIYFKKSKRYPALLEYIVRNTLEGNLTELKERTVGIEVFSRPHNYDPGSDSVVRFAAGEVRKRMALYYSEHLEAPVRIDLPPGSYTAEFRFHTRPADDAGAALPIVVAPDPPKVLSKSLISWAIKVVPAMAVAIMLIVWATYRLIPASPVDRFWAPLLKPNQGVTICLGYPFEKTLPPSNPAIPENAIANTMRKMSNSPVPDITGVNAINQYLASRGSHDEIRMANSIEFSDLHRTPAVLVGANAINPWIPRLGASLRFQFQETEQGGLHWIVDTGTPSNHGWKVDIRLPADQIPNDYVLITRDMSPATGQWWIGIGGTTATSIAEAERMVLDPAAMKNIEARLPRDWDLKNVQVVVELNLVNGSVGGTQVVASSVW